MVGDISLKLENILKRRFFIFLEINSNINTDTGIDNVVENLTKEKTCVYVLIFQTNAYFKTNARFFGKGFTVYESC